MIYIRTHFLIKKQRYYKVLEPLKFQYFSVQNLNDKCILYLWDNFIGFFKTFLSKLNCFPNVTNIEYVFICIYLVFITVINLNGFFYFERYEISHEFI